MVAAALIPPEQMRWGEDDIFQTLEFDNKLFTIDNFRGHDLSGLKMKNIGLKVKNYQQRFRNNDENDDEKK